MREMIIPSIRQFHSPLNRATRFIAVLHLLLLTQFSYSQNQAASSPLRELSDTVKIELALQDFMFAVRRSDMSALWRTLESDKIRAILVQEKSKSNDRTILIDLSKFTVYSKDLT